VVIKIETGGNCA
jgi:hypothetical protein